MDTVNEFLEPYIAQALDLLAGLDVWLQAIVLLTIVIFVIVGLFVFMKKFIKLFLVLAVLAAIFWFVYTQGYLDNILAFNFTGLLANIF
jgi:hypothetical protein